MITPTPTPLPSLLPREKFTSTVTDKLLACGAVMLSVAAWAFAPLRDVLMTVSLLASYVVMGVAWRRHPDARSVLARYIAAGVLAIAGMGGLYLQSGQVSGGTRAGVGDVFFALCYVATISAHLEIGRVNNRRFTSRVLLDALIVGSGVATMLWMTVIDPLAARSGVPLSHRIALLLYPIGDCVGITIVASLIAMSRRHVMALYYLAVTALFSLVADLGLLACRMRGVHFDGLSAAAQVLSFTAFAVAFAHPSFREFARLDLTPRRAGPLRMALLTLSTVAPSLVGIAIGSASTLGFVSTTALVLLLSLRCAELIREWEASRARWFSSMSAGALDVMAITRRDGEIVDASPNTARRLSLVGDRHSLPLHAFEPDRPSLLGLLEAAQSAESREASGEVRLMVDGSPRFFRVVVTNMLNDPDVAGLVVNAHDIDALRRLASFDPLTSLPNRASLLERLHALLGTWGTTAVLLVDLDGFKEVNDTFGHAAGDAVLTMVARRMSAVLGENNDRWVARLGGDEFVALVMKPREGEGERVAETLIAALREPVVVQGLSFTLGASVGVRIAVGGVDRSDEVLRDADIALYEAKRLGRGRMVRFEHGMAEVLRERTMLRAQLDEAIDHGELSLAYQPKVRCSDGSLVGFEALARWTRRDGQAISPGRFIPLAEETGQIVPIGTWVLDQALAQLAAWDRTLGQSHLRVAVNVSPRQLVDVTFVERVGALLRQHDIAPCRLVLELTETALMTDPDRSTRLLDQVRALGVHISIDDYGSGNASISYLRRLPVQEVKVDRSLTDGLRTGERAAVALVRSIIELAQALGLSTVAEGVEDVAQLDDLRELGCDVVQGYAIAAPMSVEKATTFIQRTPLATPSLRPARRRSEAPKKNSVAPPPN